LILLDTNVLSEALWPTPAVQVVHWLHTRFPECAISSITIFELGAGIAPCLKESGGAKRSPRPSPA